jgi:hypothetical protein
MPLKPSLTSLSYAAMSPGATRGVLRQTNRRTAESTLGTGRKLRRCTEPASCQVKVGQVRMVSSVQRPYAPARLRANSR